MVPYQSFVYYIVPSLLALVGIRKYIASKWGRCQNTVQLKGSIAIVTGANSGIGFQIAKELARRGALVICACRDMTAANRAIRRIARLGVLKTPICMELDLASLDSIRRFAREIVRDYPRIHLLVNNAGVSYPNGKKVSTQDGMEIQMGVNHFGHFLLTNLLLDNLRNTPKSRVVIVSSRLHEKGVIHINDINYDSANIVKWGYANSKLANVYFGKELSQRCTNPTVYTVCPGWVLTNLFRHNMGKMMLLLPFILPMAYLFMRTAKQGAQTPLYCATESDLENETGHFYRNCKKYVSKVELNDELSRSLWDLSLKVTKEI